MITIVDMRRANLRTMTRETYKDIQRSARRNRCSYRVGDSYISRYGIERCDCFGNRLDTFESRLAGAQWARRNGLRHAPYKIFGKDM